MGFWCIVCCIPFLKKMIQEINALQLIRSCTNCTNYLNSYTIWNSSAICNLPAENCQFLCAFFRDEHRSVRMLRLRWKIHVSLAVALQHQFKHTAKYSWVWSGRNSANERAQDARDVWIMYGRLVWIVLHNQIYAACIASVNAPSQEYLVGGRSSRGRRKRLLRCVSFALLIRRFPSTNCTPNIFRRSNVKVCTRLGISNVLHFGNLGLAVAIHLHTLANKFQP